MIDERFETLFEVLPKKPESWTINDVLEWLKLINMEKYAAQFKENSVDGLIIFELASEDILEKELGIQTLLHRRKIANAIQLLKNYSKEIERIKASKGAMEGTLRTPLAIEEGRMELTIHRKEDADAEAMAKSLAPRMERDSEKKDQKEQPTQANQLAWDIDPKKPSGDEKWLKELILQPIEGSQANFFHIKENGAKIGRHSHNQVVILDESVSRNHAEILFRNNDFFLKDIGSTTGTYIKIISRLQLKVDMIIEIGSYQFIVTHIEIYNKGEQEKSFLKLEMLDGPEGNDIRERNTFIINEAGTIGRKPNNLLKFQDDLHMSNIHCKISLVNNNYFIEDLSSTNGSWRRLSKEGQISEEYPLHHKSVFKIGNSVMYMAKRLKLGGVLELQHGDNENAECCALANSEINYELKGNACGICFEHEKNCLFLPCKHNFSCISCSKNLRQCPICKTPIDVIERIYV